MKKPPTSGKALRELLKSCYWYDQGQLKKLLEGQFEGDLAEESDNTRRGIRNLFKHAAYAQAIKAFLGFKAMFDAVEVGNLKRITDRGFLEVSCPCTLRSA